MTPLEIPEQLQIGFVGLAVFALAGVVVFLFRRLQQVQDQSQQTLIDVVKTLEERILVAIQNQRSLANPDHTAIGRILIRQGVIDDDQLTSCLLARRRGEPIGEALCRLQRVSPAAIDLALKQQKRRRRNRSTH